MTNSFNAPNVFVVVVVVVSLVNTILLYRGSDSFTKNKTENKHKSDERLASNKVCLDLRQKHCPTNMNSFTQGPPSSAGPRRKRGKKRKNLRQRRQRPQGTGRDTFKAMNHGTFPSPSVTSGLRGERGDQGLNKDQREPPGSK